MAPRTATRPARENDFSDVGKVGRRTGVTLPHGRLDVNGMEEISGIFSSPRKPSPLRKSLTVANSPKEKNPSLTPSQALSARKPVPPPRSASPRKSGISGTARRSRAIDVLGQNKEKEISTNIFEEPENRSVQTPLLASAAKRFSPEKTPLKSVTRSRSQAAQSAKTSKGNQVAVKDSVHESVETDQEPTEVLEESEIPHTSANNVVPEDDFVLPAVGDEDGHDSGTDSQEEEPEEPPLPPPIDDEEADQTFEPEARTKPRSREPTIANSRRKRKSETLETADQELEVEAISSPAAKRAKRISDQSTRAKSKDKSPKTTQKSKVSPKSKGRPALKSKDVNNKMSTRQEDELDNIVAKVKARPGQKKSLYILKRETPANDSTTHTRSGRISVKPLAYWRNERCVFGGSPGGASLQDGARFPLNSIKEIIRTEEVIGDQIRKTRKPAKGKSKKASQKQPASAHEGEEEGEEESEEGSDQELDEDHVDPDAEPWETEKGIFRGSTAVWDPQQQTYIDEEEEIDIAYAPASIETREVKDSTFRYAKLLSSKFFGSGIVDLPAGGVKKTKNSRRMHMSFFVATGRVTVQVGPLNGRENRFSIGKGGWWQVPRGNQYSIENPHSKPARVFFSQACEPIPQSDDD